MEIVYWGFIFICSLFVLIKAADLFIESAEQISLSFNIPSFIVGATLVSIGTSLPELISSGFAVVENASEVVTGNVVGSNISNIFFIIGVTILISGKILINFRELKYDFLLLIASAFILGFFLWDLHFSNLERWICVIGVVLYMIYIIKFHKLAGNKDEDHVGEKVRWTTYLKFLISAVLIFAGAKYTVESIIELAEILELGTEVIALTAVSLGTSLPELVVSISAGRKGLTDIVIGNILGSNIFNTFAVMGLPAFLGPLYISENIVNFSLPIMIIASVLFFLMALKKSGGRIVGVFFIACYLFFLVGVFYNINVVDWISNLL